MSISQDSISDTAVVIQVTEEDKAKDIIDIALC